MTIEWWQIALLTIYAGFSFYDGNNTTFGTVKPTMAGFFAGLILGDIQTGLIVGASYLTTCILLTIHFVG